MNRRHRAIATLLMSLVICAADARGQAGGAPGATAPTPPTPPPASTAVSAPVTVGQEAYADPSGKHLVIVDFITRNLTNLLNDGDAAAQGNARNNLTVAAVNLVNGAPPSPTFMLEYGKELNNAFLLKLDAKANATLRQRLNIAIVTARVAYVTENVTLVPTTIKLINDPAEPVMLWGLKAAQKQMLTVMKFKAPGNKMPPLLEAISPAVLKHPSGPAFAEGYLALTAVDPMVATELIKLWGSRLAQYQEKAPPEDPGEDGKPVYILTTAEMWKTVVNNKKMQTDVMQRISDQTSVAAQWADKITTGEKHDQLVKLVVQCASGCAVVGINIKDNALSSAAAQASNLKVETMPTGTKMGPYVSPELINAIKNAFPDVQPPPEIGQVAGVAQHP
jgi:hypothetical protein